MKRVKREVWHGKRQKEVDVGNEFDLVSFKRIYFTTVTVVNVYLYYIRYMYTGTISAWSIICPSV